MVVGTRPAACRSYFHFASLALLVLFFAGFAAAQTISAPLNRTVDYLEGTASFTVTTNPATETPWQLFVLGSADTPNPGTWITITNPNPAVNPELLFQGSNQVTFDYTENTTPFPRTNRFCATLTGSCNAGSGYVIFEFIQEPPEKTATLTPSTIEIDGFGGTRDIAVVTSPAGTPWAGVTQASWIQVLSAPMNGDGTLRIRILANTTAAQRVADVTVLNAKVRVIQAAATATFTLNPASTTAPAAGKTGAVGVTASTGNPAWTAVSNAAWITVTNGPNYTGSASVNYSVAANASDDPRTGTVTIAGQTFTVVQAGVDDEPPPPTATLSASPTSLSFVRNLGTASNTLSRTLNVTSSGDALDFTVQINSVSGGNWLSANVSSGTTPRTLELTANPGSLTAGAYTANVVITPTGGTAVTVPATLSVNPPGDLPVLPATPKSLFFSRLFGGVVPGVQRVRLSAPGTLVGADLSIQSNAWLNVALVSDQTGTFINASIRDVNLSPGIYDSAITVESNSFQFATFQIPVRYVVNLAGGSGPRISSGGLTNGATFAAGAAPNTWISVFGSGLASSTQSWNPNTTNGALLPTNVGGTEVFVGGVRAAISYVSPTQVNALVPAIAERGWVAVEVRSNGQPSEAGYLWIADRAPAFFSYAFDGGKYPAAQHGNADPVAPAGLLPRSRPAKALEAIAIYATGFGPTSPAIDPSRFFSGAAPLSDPGRVSVTVGGLNAAVEFVGLVAPGLYQINIKLAALPVGEHPLIVRIDGFTTQVGSVVIIGQ
ncbi:MAG: BACON domain-containing carbohydrate-binding protein [Bryobacterales bacterium]|nr:BACON domain-containing carbohydrate-binding protein [Bryobacterales bacterium]